MRCRLWHDGRHGRAFKRYLYTKGASQANVLTLHKLDQVDHWKVRVCPCIALEPTGPDGKPKDRNYIPYTPSTVYTVETEG